jgi:hypothetical protein
VTARVRFCDVRLEDRDEFVLALGLQVNATTLTARAHHAAKRTARAPRARCRQLGRPITIRALPHVPSSPTPLPENDGLNWPHCDGLKWPHLRPIVA